MRRRRVAKVIPSRLKPGSLTMSLYSVWVVSTTIQLSSGGGSWLRNGSYGACVLVSESPTGGGEGARIVGGVGGG